MIDRDIPSGDGEEIPTDEPIESYGEPSPFDGGLPDSNDLTRKVTDGIELEKMLHEGVPDPETVADENQSWRDSVAAEEKAVENEKRYKTTTGKKTKPKKTSTGTEENDGRTSPDGGRPSKLIDSRVGKLEVAFMRDFTVEEACSFAGIHRDTYYEWRRDYPWFSDRMDAAQNYLLTAAKHNLAERVIRYKDADISKWLLERRQKKRYAGMSVTTDPEGARELSEEDERELDEALKNAGIRKSA